jgi:hypothetical protein
MSSGSARPPIDSARATSRSCRLAATTTSKPSSANRRAVAAPMPLEAPVTTAVRPLPGRERGAGEWEGSVPGMNHILTLLQD